MGELQELRIVTVKELAKLLRVSDAYIYQCVKDEIFPCLAMPGAVIRFDLDAILRLVSTIRTKPEPGRSLKIEKRKFDSHRKEKIPLW